MKKLIFSLLAGGLCSLNAFSQENLSANIYTGWLFPYNDFTETDYIGYKPNLAVGAGMGYEIFPDVRLRGDLLYGSMNGNNSINYYETTIFEPQLGVDLNVIGLLTDEFDAVKLNLQGGTGIMLYSSRLYDRETGMKVVESPVRDQKSLSPNSFLSYGVNVSVKLSHKLDLNLGMTNRYVFDAEYIDAQQSGDYTDHYGLAQIGFIYYLKSDRKPNTVEVDQNRYSQLSREAESVKDVEQELEDSRETIATLEMEQQEQSIRIRKLQEELDSAKAGRSTGSMTTGTGTGTARTNTVTTNEGAKQYSSPKAEEVLSRRQFRIIVASLPTRQMAERWIEKSSLEKDEMVVAYIENLDTYRVIYRSFDSYEAARKEHQKIKSSIADAWIIKF